MLKICPQCHRTFSGGRLCLHCEGVSLLDVARAGTRPHLRERELQHTINTYYGARSAMLILFAGILGGGAAAVLLARSALSMTGAARAGWLTLAIAALPAIIALALLIGSRVVHLFSAVCRGRTQTLDDLRERLKAARSPHPDWRFAFLRAGALPYSAPAMLELTARAADAILGLLAREGAAGHGLRLQVIGGGCAGFSYDLSVAPGPEPEDAEVVSHGVRLFVDRRALALVEGTRIDYQDGFRFENPRAKRTCQCGESFSP